MNLKVDECRADCRGCECIWHDMDLMQRAIASSMVWIEIATMKPEDEPKESDILLLCSMKFPIFFPTMGSYLRGNFFVEWSGKIDDEMTHYCVITKPYEKQS